MDPRIEAIQAAYDNNAARLHELIAYDTDQMFLYAAISGNALDSLRYLLGRAIPIHQDTVSQYVDLDRVEALQLLLAYKPRVLQDVAEAIALRWLGLAVAQNQVGILRLLVPPLRQLGGVLRLTIGIAARAGHREAVTIVQAYTRLAAGTVIVYPDLALTIIRNQPEERDNLMIHYACSHQQSRLFVAALNLGYSEPVQSLAVHVQLNNDRGYWALQSLASEWQAKLPGLQRREVLTRRTRAALRQAMGNDLLTYVWARI